MSFNGLSNNLELQVDLETSELRNAQESEAQ